MTVLFGDLTFPMRDHIGLRRPLRLPLLPQCNPITVFPLPPSADEISLFRRLENWKKVGAAFVHLHPPDSIGSYLPSIAWHEPVLDAELYAASYAL